MLVKYNKEMKCDARRLLLAGNVSTCGRIYVTCQSTIRSPHVAAQYNPGTNCQRFIINVIPSKDLGNHIGYDTPQDMILLCSYRGHNLVSHSDKERNCNIKFCVGIWCVSKPHQHMSHNEDMTELDNKQGVRLQRSLEVLFGLNYQLQHRLFPTELYFCFGLFVKKQHAGFSSATVHFVQSSPGTGRRGGRLTEHFKLCKDVLLVHFILRRTSILLGDMEGHTQ